MLPLVSNTKPAQLLFVLHAVLHDSTVALLKAPPCMSLPVVFELLTTVVYVLLYCLFELG